MKKLNLSILLLMGVSFFISIYLTLHHYEINLLNPSTPSFCNINEYLDCDGVAKSEYSMFLGIPVSTYGLFAYAFIFMLFLHATKKEERYLLFLYPIAVVMFIFCLRELFASLFIIKKVCIFCSLLYLATFLMAILLKKRLDRSHKKIFNDLIAFIRNLLKNLKKVWNLKMIPIIALVLAIFIDRGFANHFLELKKGQDFVNNSTRTISEHTVIDLYERMGVESIDIEGSPYKGPKDAAVTITVFSDFECPACLTMGKFLDEFFNKRRNDIKMVYKYFPLDTKCNRTVSRPFHLNACTSAYYSYCAYRQGKFWDMYRLISASSPNFSLDLANSWITSLNLNKEMMDRCLTTDAVKFVEKDIEMGIDLNIDATPTIYLNNRNISFVGAREDDLNLIVDYLLKR